MTLQISELKKVVDSTCSPSSWRIVEIDFTFTLEYQFYTDSTYAFVYTRSGNKKIYRSEKAVLNDVRRIDHIPFIFFIFTKHGCIL